MEPPKTEPEKNSDKDMRAFEQLPAKAKELVLLKDQAEKTTGPENADLNRKIVEKAKPGS